MKVGLFVPGHVDVFQPELRVATLELIERFNLEVTYSFDKICCGLSGFGTPSLDEAA